MNPALQPLIARTRMGRIVLDRGARHFLHLDFGHLSASFDRDAATALRDALRVVDAGTALVLLSAFAPAVRDAEDVAAIGRALDEFIEEVAFEDRRSDDRMHRAVKPLRGL